MPTPRLYFPQGARGKVPRDLERWIQAVNDKIAALQGGLALNDYLSAVNALTLAVDQIPYATGSDSADTTDLTDQSRTLLALSTAAEWRSGLGLGALATGNTGSDVPVSGFTGILTGKTNSQAAFNTIDALSLGGLVREATDTADGTAEFLQVAATSTPSSIKRLECHFRGLVPEINPDQFNITVIDEDDTEITTAVYNIEGFIKTNGTALTGSTGAAASNIAIGGAGNSSNEYFDIEIRLTSRNGTQSRKHFWFFNTYTVSSAGLRTIGDSFSVDTTKSIKGFRIDTDNAGDMINEGLAELWVQV